ncbi:MAG: xanthine dehydrogenase family protein molybdopterin-binding subunit [Acidimicrobiia bacterium]|jgi:CO/xanthine dehydrogenase Mo-binding subunit
MSDSVVGDSVIRVGGADRVTGAQRFAADIAVEDLLHVALVRLDSGRALIDDIDTDAAGEVAGVVRVFTATDFPDPMPRFGPRFQDRPVIAAGEARFHGDPVAAVVAISREAAARGAEAVQVTSTELPGVYTIDDALAPDSPLVVDPALRDEDDPWRHSNVRQQWEWGWGDVDAIDADCVIEETYEFPMVTHFSIEPHVFMAAPDAGGVAVWSSIQHPYILQRTLAPMLGLPVSKVRIHAPDPGGGFGGKGYPKYEPLVAMIALSLGRPVRLVLSLEETFQAVRRTNTRIQLRTGFAGDGELLYIDSVADFMMGAYTDIAPRVISKSSYYAAGPYKTRAVRALARGLMSHTTPSTAFRGFGAPQIMWAIESQIDAAARALGIDRVAIRARNLAGRGEEIVRGDRPADGDWVQSLEIAARELGWDEPLPPGHGRGIAVGLKASATAGASYCILRILLDGSAILISGTSDMGQGARTIFTQLVSENLGIPIERVTLVMGDTAVVPFDYSTSASRSTVFMGSAVVDACEKAITDLVQLTAERHGVSAEDVGFEPGRLTVAGKSYTLAEIMKEIFGSVPGEIIAVGSHRGEGVPGHPLGGPAAFLEFSCTASEVAVDPETGDYELVKHVTVADVGRALNPQQVEMQDEGAAVMGLGHTLMEHLILDDGGRIVNLGALDYRIPTFKDMPAEVKSVLVENRDGPGPGGSKGSGEGGLLATSPAIAAAISEATGVVIRDLPLTPERVWQAMQAEGRDIEDNEREGSASDDQ